MSETPAQTAPVELVEPTAVTIEPITAPIEPDTVPIEPITELATLSPSRASDFKTCPQLFKFRAIDKIPEPKTVHQARGTTAHLALQRLFDLPSQQRTPEALFDLFRNAWTELRELEYPQLFESIEDERAWGIESLMVIANYFSLEDPASFEPLDRELDMLVDLGDMKIRGILDRMEEDDEGVVITDYKSGKAPPERYAIPAFFALKIYAVLIRKLTGRTPNRIRLMYLTNPTVYEVPVTDAQLDAVERKIQALWNAINRAISRDQFPPKVSRLCDWCSYKQLCPAFADEFNPNELPAAVGT